MLSVSWGFLVQLGIQMSYFKWAKKKNKKKNKRKAKKAALDPSFLQ